MRSNHPPRTTARPAPQIIRKRYPQSTLLRSLFDRRLMGLADRGGSSGYVGDAWGAHCGEWLRSRIGTTIEVNAEIRGSLASVLDVDAIPGLAAFASHAGLQNPDFLITLTVDTGQQMLVPVDAKFSVETAKPRQVSAEMASALLDAERSPVRPLLESVSGLCDGFFLSPDFELTHQVLAGASGILRAAVNRTQVLMLTAPASVLYGAADVHSLAAELAALDRSRGEAESQLAAALYYVRCAFACAAAHRDITRPLLGDRRTEPADLDEVRQALPDRTDGNPSAWTVIQEWDRDAEEVRAIRISVHQAAEVGIPNRDLREMIERYAQSAGIEAPSVNRVRRDLALWSTDQMVETFGTINYPVEDLDRLLRRLRNRARDLQAQVPARVREIVTGSASR